MYIYIHKWNKYSNHAISIFMAVHYHLLLYFVQIFSSTSSSATYLSFQYFLYIKKKKEKHVLASSSAEIRPPPCYSLAVSGVEFPPAVTTTKRPLESSCFLPVRRKSRTSRLAPPARRPTDPFLSGGSFLTRRPTPTHPTLTCLEEELNLHLRV